MGSRTTRFALLLPALATFVAGSAVDPEAFVRLLFDPVNDLLAIGAVRREELEPR